MSHQQTNNNLITLSPSHWDANLYDYKHSFVSHLATDLINLLSPKTGERILDLGCGTGYLTDKIASYGANVIGIDSAATMIKQARKSYPNVQFEVLDTTKLPFTEEFEVIFSNAALHWITEPEKVVAAIWKALKPGGRFVAEFGGKGNIKAIISAVDNALQAFGYQPIASSFWYFPSIGEYGTLLEKQGLQLVSATLFERSTPLEDGEHGMQNWLKMFANSFFQAIPESQQKSITTEIEKQLRPKLYQNSTWFADYKRIRVVAIKE